MHLKCLKIGEFAKTWLVKICTTLRSCPKGGYPTPHLPFMYNIGNNKELPLPHPMVPENQRCCGGTHRGNGRCSSERRANGWLKSGRRDRDRGPIAPVPLLVGRPIFCSQATDQFFSVLKLPLYFHVGTCILVLSECPSFLDASWQNLVNSVISLIQKSSVTMKTILQGGFDQLLAMWLSLVLSLLQVFLIRGTLFFSSNHTFQ